MKPPTQSADPRTRLRTLVAAVEHELAQGESERTAQLRQAFTSLVDALALGPEPETRRCPTCSAVCMARATLCGYCWSALTPSSSAAPALPASAAAAPPV